MNRFLILFVLSSFIIFSAVLSEQAFALKSQGNPNPKTLAKNVCGDIICDTSMTQKEKTGYYLLSFLEFDKDTVIPQSRFQISGVTQQGLSIKTAGTVMIKDFKANTIMDKGKINSLVVPIRTPGSLEMTSTSTIKQPSIKSPTNISPTQPQVTVPGTTIAPSLGIKTPTHLKMQIKEPGLPTDKLFKLVDKQKVIGLPIDQNKIVLLPKPRVLDSDLDGIPDSNDKCPTEKETRNNYQDDDGCPDTLAVAQMPKDDVIVGDPGQTIPQYDICKTEPHLDMCDRCYGLSTSECLTKFDDHKNQVYRDATIENMDLLGKDFTGADFSGSTIKNVKFAGTKLSNSKFIGSSLDNVYFSGSTDLTFAKFTNSNLVSTFFVDSDLRFANFTGMMGNNLDFQGNLEGIIFDNVDIRESFFSGNLKQSKFRNAKVIDSTFSESVIFGSDFTSSILTNSKFKSVASICSTSPNPTCDFDPLYKTTIFKDANLDNVDLSCTNKSYLSTSWSSQSWDGSCNQFWSTDFENSSFRDADSSGALFTLSYFKNTDFTGMVGEKVNFRYGNVFAGEDDEINKFANANLKNANFVRHDVWYPVDFTGANCEGAYYQIDVINNAYGYTSAIPSCVEGLMDYCIEQAGDHVPRYCPIKPGRND